MTAGGCICEKKCVCHTQTMYCGKGPAKTEMLPGCLLWGKGWIIAVSMYDTATYYGRLCGVYSKCMRTYQSVLYQCLYIIALVYIDTVKKAGLAFRCY